MATNTLDEIFTPVFLENLFPETRSDNFFEALFGDAQEGAFTIQLKFREQVQNELQFELHLKRRPGKCLVCNLTYGLPQVFSKHPVINIQGVVDEIGKQIGNGYRLDGWQLGATREASRDVHVVPLTISLAT
ncbi:MAG: pancreas/duodenum homeobox protein 1 [Deltaproteobacteria bacterium]|nr:pancreas/duodenum homeobox protein 1 [Deltaproteobacteria bacterium]